MAVDNSTAGHPDQATGAMLSHQLASGSWRCQAYAIDQCQLPASPAEPVGMPPMVLPSSVPPRLTTELVTRWVTHSVTTSTSSSTLKPTCAGAVPQLADSMPALPAISRKVPLWLRKPATPPVARHAGGRQTSAVQRFGATFGWP